MALARVVSFEGVPQERIDQMKKEIEGSDPPEGMNPTGMMILYDGDAQKSLAIVLFANEEDYKRGDEILSAMPRDDTPGQRTSVEKYDVAIDIKR